MRVLSAAWLAGATWSSSALSEHIRAWSSRASVSLMPSPGANSAMASAQRHQPCLPIGTRSERSSRRTRSASTPACGALLRGINRAKSEPPIRASSAWEPPCASTSLRRRSAEERSHWSVNARDRWRLICARSRWRNMSRWPPASAVRSLSAARKRSMKYLRFGSQVTASRWISLCSDSIRAFCSSTVASTRRRASTRAWSTLSRPQEPDGEASAPGARARTRWLMSRDALVSMRRARLMANSAQNRPALSASPTARTPPCQSVSFASVASP